MLNLKHRNGKSKLRNWFILGTAVLITLALIPYGLVADYVPAFDYFVDSLFSSEWSHVVGHLGIFALMGTAVLLVFPTLQKKPHFYFSLMALLALLQEFLQIITVKHRPINQSDIFDFVTDMVAATITYCIIVYLVRNRTEVHLSADYAD